MIPHANPKPSLFRRLLRNPFTALRADAGGLSSLTAKELYDLGESMRQAGPDSVVRPGYNPRKRALRALRNVPDEKRRAFFAHAAAIGAAGAFAFAGMGLSAEAAQDLTQIYSYVNQGGTPGSPGTGVEKSYQLALLARDLGMTRCASITAVQNITGQVAGDAAFLTLAGRAGTFIWSSANLSTQVTSDPQQGIYIAPASAPTGASGAWIRQYNEAVYASWWGASTSLTDNYTPVQAAINFFNNTYGEIVFATGTYNFNSAGLTSNGAAGLRFRGETQRGTVWNWTSATAAPIFTAQNTLDNFEVENISFNNTGSATIALDIYCVRVKLNHLFANPTVKFSTGIIRTNINGTVYDFVMRDCALFSSQSGQENPYALLFTSGHTCIIDRCMFSGHLKSVIFGDATHAVNGVSVTNSRFEHFSGLTPPYPGGPNCIAIDVQNVYGMNICGNNFEMSSDTDPSTSNQRAISLTIAHGVNISGNWLSGNGICTAIVRVAASTADGIQINGNSLYGVTNYCIEATGSGSLTVVQLGSYALTNCPVGAINQIFTPALLIGGASTGITYTSQAGRYWRCGNRVGFNIQVVLSSKGALTGIVQFGSLPITPKNTGVFQACAVVISGCTGISGGVTAQVDTSTGRVTLLYLGTGGQTAFADTNLTNTSTLIVSGEYEVA